MVNGLHERFQSAYKVHHSTETALLMTTSTVTGWEDNVFLLLLDLSVAFDMVNHSLLLPHVHLENSFGITRTVPQWFSFLSVWPISVR